MINLLAKIQKVCVTALVPLTAIELGFIQLASAETIRFKSQQEITQECISIAQRVYGQATTSSYQASSKAESFCNRGGDPYCLVKAYNNYSQSTFSSYRAVSQAEDVCSN